MDRFKFSTIGHPLSIIRMILSILPLVATLAPMGKVAVSLPFFQETTTINIVSIVTKVFMALDIDHMLAMVGSEMVGKAYIFYLVALVGLVGVVITTIVNIVNMMFATAKKGIKRYISTAVAGIIFTVIGTVGLAMWLSGVTAAVPEVFNGTFMIWGTLFDADSQGWVNATLIELGFYTEPIAFFKDADYVMPLCIVVALWTSLGTAFLSFIAGLQGVDRSLYEAGAVDGIKNRGQELWFITLPSMKPQLMFGAIMAITGAFGFGGIVTALCGFPSVDYAAHTIMHHLEDYGGARYEIGYSSAIAVILFVVMVGANMLVKKMLSKVGS
jgi:ABC-type sugar transport system permease subunit